MSAEFLIRSGTDLEGLKGALFLGRTAETQCPIFFRLQRAGGPILDMQCRLTGLEREDGSDTRWLIKGFARDVLLGETPFTGLYIVDRQEGYFRADFRAAGA